MPEELPTPPWPDPEDPLFRVTVETALDRAERFGVEHAIVHAAGHGWMEGHVLAEEGREPRPEPIFVATDEMPTPPFPSHRSDDFAAIFNDELRRYEQQGGEALSEILIAAAARGWAGGYQEGLSCIGCMPPGGEETLALRSLLRKGLIPIRPELDPVSEELFAAVLATYKEQLAARSR